MLQFGFYKSINGDRSYTADDLNEMVDGIISDGIISNIGDEFEVTIGSDATGNGRIITIGTGKALISNTWNKNTEPFELEISDINESSRYDSICLYVNKLERRNSIICIEGVESLDPKKPNLLSDNMHTYFPLAHLLISENSIKIEDSRIYARMILKNEVEYQTGIVTSDSPVKAGEPVSFWNGNVRAHLDNDIYTISASNYNGAKSNISTVKIDGKIVAIAFMFDSSLSNDNGCFYILTFDADNTYRRIATSVKDMKPPELTSVSKYSNPKIYIRYIDGSRIYFSLFYRADNLICGYHGYVIVSDNATSIGATMTKTTIGDVSQIDANTALPQVERLNSNGDYLVLASSSTNSPHIFVFDKDNNEKIRIPRSGRYVTITVLEQNVFSSTAFIGTSGVDIFSIYFYKLIIDNTGKYSYTSSGEGFNNKFTAANDTVKITIPLSENACSLISNKGEQLIIFGNYLKPVPDGYILRDSGLRTMYDSYGDLCSFFNMNRDNTLPIMCYIYQTTGSYANAFTYWKQRNNYLECTGINSIINKITRFRENNSSPIRTMLEYIDGYLVGFGNFTIYGENADFGFFIMNFNLDNMVALDNGDPGDTVRVIQQGKIYLKNETAPYSTMGVSLKKISDHEYEVMW